MPSPIVPNLLILISLIVLFSIVVPCSVVIANSSSVRSKNIISLIKEVCSSNVVVSTTHQMADFDSKLCIQILESEQQITSATNLLDLSISIMKLGISNATETRAHMEKYMSSKINSSNLKGATAIRECRGSYNSVVGSFKSALSEVENDKEYLTATYDLLIASTDNIQRCVEAVEKERIRDGIILSGNKVVPIFGLSAYQAVDSLLNHLQSAAP